MRLHKGPKINQNKTVKNGILNQICKASVLVESPTNSIPSSSSDNACANSSAADLNIEGISPIEPQKTKVTEKKNRTVSIY